MALTLDLKGKPWFVGAIIGAILGIGLVVACHYLLLKPMQEEIIGLEKNLQDLQAKVAEGQAAAASLPRFQEEIARLEKELQKLVQVLPSKRETYVILKKIKSLADAGDFGFKSFIPGASMVDKDFYLEWPISVQLDGTYHNLAIFFDRLRNFPRIINVGDLEMNAVPGRPNITISTRFTILTYVYKEVMEGGGQ